MKHTPLEHLFRLLRASSRLEARRSKRDTRGKHGFLLRNYIWIFQIIPFGLAVLLAMARKFCGAPEWVAFIGLLMLLVLYLASLAHPFLLAWVHRKALSKAANNPFELLLGNASTTASVDSLLIPKLLRSPIEDIELLALELKAEKEFFERRLSLVVGSIEKIGLAPGLLAAGISLSNIKSIQSEWVVALAYATPLLYLFGASGHFLLMRLDRMVKVTELALARKKALTSPSKEQPEALLGCP